MNILFVVPYVPSLIRVRPYNLIRHLSARGHKLTVATLWTNRTERQELDELGKHCAEVKALPLPAWRSLLNCVQALPSGEPLQARYSWSSPLSTTIANLTSSVDIVHAEHLRGARYGLQAYRSSRTPVVWDSVDCITDLFGQAVQGRRDRLGRSINQFELLRTRRYEGWLVSQFDRVLVTSAVDKKSLLTLSQSTAPEIRGEHVTVLPNGVDLDYFTPAAVDRDPDTLVFSGKMSYHANESAVIHLVQDVMPRVWSTRPATRVVVVGKDPSTTLRRAVADHTSRVTLTGTVPDLRPYLRRAAVATVPLVYGVGCQNKVLEAMACGTPVVATPRAVSALSARPGRDVLVAEGPEAFANAVLDLLGNPLRRREVGLAGRRYVEAQHRWDQIAGRLEAIYEDVLSERHGRRHATARSLVSA